MSFKLELKKGKFDFDKALKELNGNHQVRTEAIQRFAEIQAQLFKEELLAQYSAYCQIGTDNGIFF
jgi:hypothetical protein